MNIDEWVDVPGYEGIYQANYHGEVKRLYKTKSKIMTPYHKRMKGSQRLVIKLTKNGKSKEVKLLSLIARTFLGPCPKGYIPIHINGMQSDNCVGNIQYITKSEAGKLTGGNSRRKPVVKIDVNGNEVDFYKSAREAARCNFMSYQTIIDRCNNKTKSVYAPDGYIYKWDK